MSPPGMQMRLGMGLTLSKGVRWSQASLSPDLFFDFRSASRLWQDSTGNVTPVSAANDPIGYAGSITGATALKQTTASKRPVWASDGTVQFDGVDDAMQASFSATIGTGNVSVCAWVYPTTQAAKGFVIGSDGATRAINFMVNSTFGQTQGSGYWTFGLTGGGQWLIYDVQSNVVPANSWTFLCGVRTSSTSISLYRNGVVESSAVVRLGVNAVSVPSITTVDFGYAVSGPSTFPGKIGRSSIYLRALTVQEIAKIYADGP